MLFMGGNVEYWEGKAHFSPTGTEIEFFVDGEADSNMKQQHQFYEVVSSRWRELLPQITERVRLETDFTAGDELSISSMSIPDALFSDHADWEVSFDAEPSGHIWSVQMKGSKPASVEFDLNC